MYTHHVLWKLSSTTAAEKAGQAMYLQVRIRQPIAPVLPACGCVMVVLLLHT